MSQRTRVPWVNCLLAALCVGAIVAAVLVVGPASGKQTTVTRTAKAAQGVVQSTVSGSGNLQASSQLNLGFKTSGTVTDIYVNQGQHVVTGQLLAALDPQSAEVTLEQAKANLQSAEANLAKEEETGGETSTGQGSGNSAAATTASVRRASVAEISSSQTTPPTTSTPATNAPSTGAPTTTTTPSASTPTSENSSATTTGAAKTPSTTNPAASTGEKAPRRSKTSSEASSEETSSGGSSSGTTVSSATREANLASARAAVRSDTLTVHGEEEAVANTKLYAPQDGTIVSLSGQVGEVVSASGTTKASAGSGSSSESAAGGTSAAGGSSSARTSSASSSSSSSSSSFAVLSDLSSMRLVVALSESEIGNVKDGQIATVTVEALNGRKLAAHVSEVAILSTSDSGVVSYDVTFQLDQMEAGLKPGMSATAEVVVKQAEGVNVPTSAISGGSVTVIHDGKQERRAITTGLAGNTSTIVSSGLKAGETVLLPVASAGTSSLSSRLASRLGGGTLGGGGGGFAGGGFAGARFSGGGFRGGGG